MPTKPMAIVFFFCIRLSTLAHADDYCQKFDQALAIFNENAYNSSEIYSEGLTRFANYFLESLDPDQVLLSNDVATYISSLHLADTAKPVDNFCAIINDIATSVKTSLERSLSILDSLNSQIFDFHKVDSLSLKPEFKFSSYQKNHAERWECLLKYSVLKGLIDNIEQLDSNIVNTSVIKPMLEEKTRYRCEIEKNKLVNLLENEDNLYSFIFSAYINCYLAMYDPHSNYLPQQVFARFFRDINTSARIFGFSLEKGDNGHFYIASIMPGSYAWQTGEINIGDVVVKLSESKNKTIDLTMAEPEDVSYFMAGTGDKVVLEVLNKQNKRERVTLYKTEVKNNENGIRAVILEGRHKTGYIYLPAFYTSWETEAMFGCAQDIAKAIYALKKEGIGSLIIDVRENGGGSIKEAIELAGIFIDYGTLAIMRNQEGQLISLKILTAGDVHRAPGHYGRSGKRIGIGNARRHLQDYNRAVVVGGNTFGKATGQIMLPIAKDLSKINDPYKADNLKITDSKFYRVTGKSCQQTGVAPDILLPQLSNMYIGTEKNTLVLSQTIR
ncbi:MAG: PDZ domain-containing protein [Bacteroidales bacterium]|nr:PDZ domain-containing protein [Bacteroidales bacterium]